jgi:pyruvate/2-oxoglutarate dehydrogenase complex dihydrolipoamide dehydrogenase (E3) component
VDVFLGQGRFASSDTIEVEGQNLLFKKAVIATGARAAVPPIPGLDQVKSLTNETIFSLTELPKRLGIIGAGPIGCELAQAFRNLGSEVFLIETEHGILPKEDREAAAVVEAALKRDGVALYCCGRELQLVAEGERIRLTVESHGTKHAEVVDQLLIATGRAPNVEHMGLEIVGVEFDVKTGIVVNDKLQTTNCRIYAAGDCCAKYKFTHAADFMARIVIANALFFGRSKQSALTIPWCTYTSPELAHVGLTEEEAKEQGIAIDTYVQPFTQVDRAILDGETEGFVKVHTKKGKDKILGATIIAPHAGDMMGEISLAMTNGLGLKQIAKAIHPYPTQAEAIRKLGDQYNKTRLTPFVKGLLRKWLAWMR